MKGRVLLVCVLGALLLLAFTGAVGVARESQEPAAPESPLDTPVTMITGGVADIELVTSANKIFWYEQPSCEVEPPARQIARAATNVTEERVSRITINAFYTRTLYTHTVEPDCGQQDFAVLSNVAADSDHLYWLAPAGLMRASTDTNPGDHLETANNFLSGPGEVVRADGRLFAAAEGEVWWVSTTGGLSLRISTTPGTDLQADDAYVYWLDGNDALKAYELDSGQTKTIATNVTGYYTEGERELCLTICVSYRRVYFAQGHRLYVYEHIQDTVSGPLYTSSDTGSVIHEVTADGNGIYFFESREASCGTFICYQHLLQRIPRNGSNDPDTLYVHPAAAFDPGPADLHGDGTFLFWRDGSLLRLPTNASALPVENMWVERILVTQGVQDAAHSVRLIEGKQTYVRVLAQSQEEIVYGVDAQLWATWDGQSQPVGPLLPINEDGYWLTVFPFELHSVLDGAYLFVLPREWTTKEGLNLRAELNPGQFPLEPDYTDNTLSTGALSFSPSPRLELELFGLGYPLSGTIKGPRLIDFDLTKSWLRRTYPLASAPLSPANPQPGLRASTTYVNMGEWFTDVVLGNDAFCILLYAPDDLNKCAGLYALPIVAEWRLSGLAPDDPYAQTLPSYYGLISDEGAFARGKAEIGGRVGIGPAGDGWSWDDDPAYTDWYSGHEIAHGLGRKHPSKGNWCEHSADDANYPYAGSRIGPSGGTLEGFDPGAPALDAKRKLLPSYMWHDLMGYCDYQWISDYTYEGLYQTISAVSAQTPLAPRQGHFLFVGGAINPQRNVAALTHVKAMTETLETPALVPGPYSLRLLDGAGQALADYPFTPSPDPEGDVLFVNQLIDAVAGATGLQLVRLADDAVMAEQPISPNAPTVTAVSLEAAQTPVTGTVSLTWQAHDADGDPLQFDLLYSDDGGANFQVVQSGLAGSSTAVDTATLGGGTTSLFRVVAHDGVHTGHGDSDPFEMATKPPVPRILDPADGQHFHYGQMVNLYGEAFDAQVGGIDGSDLVWRDGQGSVLGTGSWLTLDDLPAGPTTLTLTASRGQATASTSITIYVDDDVALPAPTLAVGPSSVGWHVASDETATQTAELLVAGRGGPLSWTASTDADWLTLDADDDATPGTVTLFADATAVADGETLQATVDIVPSGEDPAGTRTVTVTLSKGNVWVPDDPGIQIRQLFLPSIRH